VRNGAPSSGAADLEIRVDLTTLIGLDDTGAELAGYGPVIAEIARDLATPRRGAMDVHRHRPCHR
jgi:hypothetical protein